MTEKLKTTNGQALLDMDLPPTQFVVENLLPQGLHIFAGAPKTGKSWLLLLLSLKVANGEKLWNLQTAKGTVLSLCLEDSLSRIQQRLSELTDEAPPNLFFSTISKSLEDGLVAQIENFISEHADTNLVIIDTLQMVRQSCSNSNLYAADYKDIGLLKPLADQYRISIVVVQHLRKQPRETLIKSNSTRSNEGTHGSEFDTLRFNQRIPCSDPHSMISGSAGLVGAADGSYVLKRENNLDKEAKLYIRGRDISECVLTLKQDEDSGEWLYVSCDTELENSVSGDESILKLIEFMKRENVFNGTASELAEKCSVNISGNSMSRKMRKYEKQLNENGIEFVKSRTGERREIMIVYSVNDDMTIKNVCSDD